MKQTNYGVASPDEVKLHSGYEFVKHMQEGLFPAAPIAKVMQFHLTEVEQGRVIFSAQPSSEFYNPLGTVHGGYTTTLLDSCMGCAVHSTLPVGMAYTTLEIKINFVR
ncbi:MAG TPA: PaaI family thioesterase, partial [Candidatus Angelobacter sp.]|nr:PaaI family thioesterase [Candidatus Angelobacter sp.]